MIYKSGGRIIAISIVLVMASCSHILGDPVWLIKRTISHNHSVSHQCIKAAAREIGANIHRLKKDPENRKSYQIHKPGGSSILIYNYLNDRKVILSAGHVGTTTRENDRVICALIESYHKALINKCKINEKLTRVKNEFNNSKCK